MQAKQMTKRIKIKITVDFVLLALKDLFEFIFFSVNVVVCSITYVYKKLSWSYIIDFGNGSADPIYLFIFYTIS